MCVCGGGGGWGGGGERERRGRKGTELDVVNRAVVAKWS